MRTSEKRIVTVKLNYNQANKLLGMKWIDYIKCLVMGV